MTQINVLSCSYTNQLQNTSAALTTDKATKRVVICLFTNWQICSFHLKSNSVKPVDILGSLENMPLMPRDFIESIYCFFALLSFDVGNAMLNKYFCGSLKLFQDASSERREE